MVVRWIYVGLSGLCNDMINFCMMVGTCECIGDINRYLYHKTNNFTKKTNVLL